MLELVRAGRPVRVVPAELGLAEATVLPVEGPRPHRPPGQARASTSERGELAAARQQIKELGTELALVTQAGKRFEEGCTQSHLPVIARAGQPGLLGETGLPDPGRGRLRVLPVAAPPSLSNGSSAWPG